MGSSAGIMMAGSMGAQGISSMGTAYAQSQAIKSQGEYQQNIAKTNAALAGIKGEQAINAGDFAAKTNDMKTSQEVGSERAHLAAQGIDVNSGSAAQAQGDTAAIGALDSLTIRNNAWREAWGYKVQAVNDTYSGQFEGMAANYGANNTLLTGGMTAATDFGKAGYYGYKG